MPPGKDPPTATHQVTQAGPQEAFIVAAARGAGAVHGAQAEGSFRDERTTSPGGDEGHAQGWLAGWCWPGVGLKAVSSPSARAPGQPTDAHQVHGRIGQASRRVGGKPCGRSRNSCCVRGLCLCLWAAGIAAVVRPALMSIWLALPLAGLRATGCGDWLTLACACRACPCMI